MPFGVSTLRTIPEDTSGLAEGAAEVIRLKPIYDQEKLDAMLMGQPFPQDFRTWLAQRQYTAGMKILPR